MSHKFQSSRSYYFQLMLLDQRSKPPMAMIRILGQRPQRRVCPLPDTSSALGPN
jgi:hypothetical protein